MNKGYWDFHLNYVVAKKKSLFNFLKLKNNNTKNPTSKYTLELHNKTKPQLE